MKLILYSYCQQLLHNFFLFFKFKSLVEEELFIQQQGYFIIIYLYVSGGPRVNTTEKMNNFSNTWGAPRWLD